MREFVSKSRLRSMSFENRLIYSTYLCFSLAACVVIAFLVLQRTGILPHAFAEHYLGNEAEMKFEKSTAELLEITHFHLFSYPLFLLVHGHLFMMTAWPGRLKCVIVMASFVGCALYLAAPWLVHAWGQGWAWVSVPSRLMLGGSILLFIFVPLLEMWFSKAETTK